MVTKTSTWAPFKPIQITVSSVTLPNGFRDRCRNWVIENGEINKISGFYTSFDCEHKQDWLAPVLEQIAPIEKYDSFWIQAYDVGGWHTEHNHEGPDIVLSGCLYLDKGRSSIFQDPLHPSQHTSMPVEEGTVLYWDPALYHCSSPEQTERTILAFNLND